MWGASTPSDKEIEEQIKTIESRRKLDAITTANIDKVYDFLYVKTFGKIIDSNYLAYVNALMIEYFNEHKIYDYSVKRNVLESVIKRHLWDKLKQDPYFTPTIIERANEYNEETHGSITIRP